MIPDALFFALVSNCDRDTLYIGYGQICPKGNYVLIDLGLEETFTSCMWLDEDAPLAFTDIMDDFDPRRDLFTPPRPIDKKDWEDIGKFRIISRLVLDPITSLQFLVQLDDGVVETALHRAETEARTSGMTPEVSYVRIEQIHTMRGGLVLAGEQLKQGVHRQSTADALRNKLKKMKGE